MPGNRSDIWLSFFLFLSGAVGKGKLKSGGETTGSSLPGGVLFGFSAGAFQSASGANRRLLSHPLGRGGGDKEKSCS